MIFTLSSEELTWLKDNYPSLKFHGDTKSVITGLFTFEAVYQNEKDKKKYPVIKDDYGIEIKLETNNFSSLPQVKEIGGKIPAGIHVNPDGTVCLCPYTAEKEKLPRGFNLKDFFVNLLIPYFYAQTYNKKYGEWPWGEYSHGELGLLEHYLENRKDGENKELIIEMIENFKKSLFSDSYFELIKKDKIKGHILCFCGSKKRIRICHNLSFKGLWHLKEDIKRNKIELKKV